MVYVITRVRPDYVFFIPLRKMKWVKHLLEKGHEDALCYYLKNYERYFMDEPLGQRLRIHNSESETDESVEEFLRTFSSSVITNANTNYDSSSPRLYGEHLEPLTDYIEIDLTDEMMFEEQTIPSEMVELNIDNLEISD